MPALSRVQASISMKGTNDEQRDVQLAAASTSRAYPAGDRPRPRAQQQSRDAGRAPDAREQRPHLPLSRRRPRAARPTPRPRPPSGGRGRLHVGAVRIIGAVQCRACTTAWPLPRPIRARRVGTSGSTPSGGAPQDGRDGKATEAFAHGLERGSLQGGDRFRFVRMSAVQKDVHHEGTSTASGPSAARRTPGATSAYLLTGCGR
jgi:hypothetical protein